VSPPWRILLVDHAPVFGGVEAMLCDLASSLDRTKFEPLIATNPDSPAIERLRRAVVLVRTTALGQLSGLWLAGPHLLQSAVALASIARRERVNLIHTFTARTHLIGAIAASVAGLPLVWRLNDETLPLLLARAFGRVPRRVIAVSAYLAGRYHALPAPIRIIPDGASSHTLAPSHSLAPTLPHPLTPSAVTLAARLVRWKGQRVFIEAMAEALKYMPGLQGEIVGSASAGDNRPGMLGGGPPYERELHSLADSLGLQQALSFHAFREPAALFSGSALAVHTSLLPEPFGRTIVEAMAWGVPVIATRGGAVPEIVVNGVTGRLVPAGNPAALAEAIVGLMADPERRQAMGAAGRACAAECFTVEQMARRFETVWQEVLA
jgi:glycosyltransferase involved in cell wall biosynthesis